MQVDAQAAGFDESRLARIETHLRSRYIDPGKIAGAQVAIMRCGEVAYFESFGFADLGRDSPVADDTIWRLYSMTKPITGVAMMTLYEQGHFQLDDPIHRWIPEWRDMTVSQADGHGGTRVVPADRAPTIKDILSHTSGIGYGPENRDLDLEQGAWRENHDLASLATAFGEWPLRFQPGTQWLYSHGMDVAARIIEIISGKPYDQYLQEAIFDPLGMLDTGFFVREDQVDRFSVCYARNSRKELFVLDDPTTSNYLTKPKFLNGGGGLVGTTRDYLRFCSMLANGGELDGTRILARKTIELMASNHLAGDGEMSDFALPTGYGEVGFEGTGFGLTVAVGKGPQASGVVGSVGEFRWGGAASTTFWVDPSEDLAVVFMTQLLPSGTFNFPDQLKALVYGAML